MHLPDHREHVDLSGVEVSEFERLTSVFEVTDEHLLDTGILTVFYAG
ncbi:hypothetical protein CATRI_09510 [Corynebacterium atrinae]|nr:hypothetical protein [Corynebacterium atrinae]WJY63970.1 hypothetical protein CATRI_09510 [Corynebacterium atrinae]